MLAGVLFLGVFGWKKSIFRVQIGMLWTKNDKTWAWQFFVTFLGWLSDPFQWLNDLQIGDEKVTLNHLGESIEAFNNFQVQPSQCCIQNDVC